jgi:putative DNA primase/helicase
MNSFHDALIAHGLRVKGAPVADGQWHRVPTDHKPKRKNGAYCLATDGRIGWYWDLALDTATVTWRADGKQVDSLPPPVDYAAIRRRRQAERMDRRRAVDAARAFYADCPALIGGHGYLRSKGLDMTGCRGLKVDGDGWLVVPMERGGRLMSVQRIAADGDKRFWPGAPVSGTSYVVDRQGAALTVLCEGLATGLAIFAAVPNARVVVAFTAGNMPKVAAKLPRVGMAVVAADNDHQTEARTGRNPGLASAEEAAALLGCAVAVPEGIEGTDWCDLRAERLAARGQQVYGKRRETGGSARRAVDAQIAGAMMRSARFLPVTG